MGRSALGCLLVGKPTVMYIIIFVTIIVGKILLWRVLTGWFQAQSRFSSMRKLITS